MTERGKKINLAIPITPYTMRLMEDVISLLKDKDVVNVLINPHGLKYKENLWDEVYSMKCSRKVSNLRLKKIFNRIYQMLCFSLLNVKLKKYKHKKVNLYYIDLAHVLSNHIFFNFKNLDEIFVVEDGLLNYNDSVTLEGKMISDPKFRFVSKLFGLNIKHFEGHITGLRYKKVMAQYVSFPSMSIFPNKSIGVSYERLEYLYNKDIVLIIGVDVIVGSIPKSEYENYLEQILFKLEEIYNGDFTLYYKPHHHGVKNLMKNFLESKIGKNFIYYDNNEPIEKLVHLIQPSHLISFGSTASMVLKRKLPEFVRNDVFFFRSNNGAFEVFKNLEINVNKLVN